MIECLILGDSIAKGVSDVRKDCVAHVRSGINSHDYVNRHLLYTGGDTRARTVIISLGSNDTKNINTFEELHTLRQLVSADRVYWIIPNIKETKRRAVWDVARRYNDWVIDSRSYDRSSDTVHPTYSGYRAMAKDLR
jgi:lysophospholipase L1-like esterase